MLSPNWPSYIRQITKRESIYYDDYKGSENSKEVLDEMKPLYRLPQKTKVRSRSNNSFSRKTTYAARQRLERM